MKVDETWTGLAEAVNAVREELIAARDLGAGTEMPFEVGPIEMEFEVTLKKAATGNAGVEVWVIEAGTSGSLTAEKTHRLKITLQPQTGSGKPAKIGRSPSSG